MVEVGRSVVVVTGGNSVGELRADTEDTAGMEVAVEAGQDPLGLSSELGLGWKDFPRVVPPPPPPSSTRGPATGVSPFLRQL